MEELGFRRNCSSLLRIFQSLEGHLGAGEEMAAAEAHLYREIPGSIPSTKWSLEHCLELSLSTVIGVASEHCIPSSSA